MTSMRSFSDTLHLPTAILGAVEQAWSHGWQPYELHRQVRRLGDRATVELAETVLLVDHLCRPSDHYHPQWIAQIEQLGVLGRPDPSADWADDQPTSLMAELAVMLMQLPILTILMPPPKGIELNGIVDLAGMSGDQASLDPTLVKVRLLLDKAEATDFPPEAETFTAKAHELIARHSIDEAMLSAEAVSAGRKRSGSPVTIRIPIEAPYVKPKYVLAQLVAEAGGCRAVYTEVAAMTSIVGHPSDVTAVELLYTSLLVQSQTALNDEGRNAGSGGRSRSRGFRSSFLLSYAYRIGERLAEVQARVQQQAQVEHGTNLLPVLAEREAAVEEHFEVIFPKVRSLPIRGGRDAAGWQSGRSAANAANLGGEAVGGAKRSIGRS